MSTAVTPGKILEELGDLWIGLGEQDGKSAVLRACAMTLVVVTADEPRPQDTAETIAGLMMKHPCRAIVLRCGRGSNGHLESKVLAQCWVAGGGRQHICCEQIEISAPEESLGEVPAIIRGLLVPDLPVTIYCRDASLLGLPMWQDLAPLATRLIVDSASEPAFSAFQALRGLTAWECLLADLSWTRLTRLRQAIAQIFESRERLDRLADVEEITIATDGTEVPVPAWFLAAWLARGMGWTLSDGKFSSAGRERQLRFQPAVGEMREPPPGVRAGGGVKEVRFAGRDVNYRLTRTALDTVEVRLGHVTRSLSCKPWSEGDLLSKELSLAGRDLLFRGMLRIVLPWVLEREFLQ